MRANYKGVIRPQKGLVTSGAYEGPVRVSCREEFYMAFVQGFWGECVTGSRTGGEGVVAGAFQLQGPESGYRTF